MDAIQDIFRFARAAYEFSLGDPLFDSCYKIENIVRDNDTAFVAVDSNRIIISFCGTNDLKDWISNFKCEALAQGKTIHQGFYDSWVKFKDAVSGCVVAYPEHAIFCTGHSRGAALATLCARHIAKNMMRPCSCINFASPMVFNKDGRDEFDMLPVNMTHVVNEFDWVTELPLEIMGYRHVGKEYLCPQPWYMKWIKLVRRLCVMMVHLIPKYQAAIDREAK